MQISIILFDSSTKDEILVMQLSLLTFKINQFYEFKLYYFLLNHEILISFLSARNDNMAVNRNSVLLSNYWPLFQYEPSFSKRTFLLLKITFCYFLFSFLSSFLNQFCFHFLEDFSKLFSYTSKPSRRFHLLMRKRIMLTIRLYFIKKRVLFSQLFDLS